MTTPNGTSERPHIVLSAIAMWSHFRGICVIAAKLAAERPLTITLLVPYWSSTFTKAQKEVARCLADVDLPLGEVRIIAVGEHTVEPLGMIHVTEPMFEPIWKCMLEGLPIKCSATDVEHPPVGRPRLIALGLTQYTWFKIIRSSTKEDPIPVLMWMMLFSGGFVQFFLPERYGGTAELVMPEFTDEERKHGRRMSISGKIRHIRGAPAMYDWEFYPQYLPYIRTTDSKDPAVAIELWRDPVRFTQEADGIVTSNTPGYDGEEMLSNINDYFAENNRPAFHFGPTIPLRPGTSDFSKKLLDEEMAAAPPDVGDQVQTFLDSNLKSRGEKCVIYICFGSMFWPPNPEHLWLFLRTLGDRKIPFIISLASPHVKLPEDIKTRFMNSLDGSLISWAPQQTILAHKCVGWFVTHGGAGGTMDALTQGVPMIGWPFQGDQPINITHLVRSLDVAFEFVEVRTEPWGLKPILASGKTPTGTLEAFQEEVNTVLDELQSDIGIRKATNARKHQKLLAEAWSADGPARKDFDELIRQYSL